jgi:DNA-binding NarL/FixJ family response regulator
MTSAFLIALLRSQVNFLSPLVVPRAIPTGLTGLKLNPTRVLLADDHALVRAGIRALLSTIEGVEVIAEAGNGREALQLIRELQPDIVLLDIAMPDLSGLEVLKESKKDFPDLRVIILTVHEAGEYAMEALRAGAAGYLPKSAAANELQVAIKIVSRGDTYVSGEVSRKTLLEFSKGATEHTHFLARLTPRQREILTLIAEGHSTKDIARRLNISVKTVESHRAQLMERLDIHDVAGLVRFAIKKGLVKVE